MAQALKDRAEAATADAVRTGARYGEDLYTWVQEQVEHLRAGRLDLIDASNIAEELSDVGNEQYDKLESALAVLLMHMLKWDHQPERRSRSWQNTIAEQRRRIERVLRKNPGLKPHVAEAILDGYLDGRGRAASEMDVDVTTFAPACPYAWDEILTRPFDYESRR